jgi:RHS repeat-associated protein
MKKLLLLIGFFLLNFTLYSQKDSTKRDTLVLAPQPPASNTNKYTPNLVLPSPHAATLGNYGNVPVNLSSGLPSPSIGLFDLKEGDVDLDVGLSYQYRGFKPFESPSLLGRGWSLNAGGVITRIIKSKIDEQRPVSTSSSNYGYAASENRTQLAGLINSDGTVVSGGSSISYSSPDGEPDMFIFNFMGMTGKFFFGEEGIIHVVSDRKIKIDYRVYQFPQAIPGTATTNRHHLVEFTITDENGTVYKFGDSSSTVIYPIKNVEFSTSGSDYDCLSGNLNITSWFLAEATDKNGRKITFNYTNDYMSSNGTFNYTSRGRNVSSPVTRGQYKTATQTYTHENIWHCVGSFENFLTSVSGTNWKVTFDYSKTGNVSYLTKTTLFANTSPTTETKKFTFDFLNLNNPDGLLLSTLIESSPDNTITKSHGFSYNDPNNLTYNNFYGLDYQGFDNGAVTNTSLIADAPFNANRSPNFTTTLKGALTKITYPTAGSTEFDYEQNEYGQIRESEYENSVLINKKAYGGIRVKTITDKDINGTTLSQRTINYDSFSNSSKSSGIISATIGLTKIVSNGAFTSSQSPSPSFPTLSNGTIYYSEGFHSIAEIPIYYTNVTETLSDGAATKTAFTSHNDYNDYFGINFGRGNDQIGSPASYLLMRSLPKSIKHYRNDTLVKEKIIAYNLVDRHKARSLFTGGITATATIPTIDLLKTYYTYSGWLQKTSETDRLYDNANNFIETVSTSAYNNTTYLQASSMTTTSSKGETLLMEFKYPYDFSTQPYLTMVNKNIIAPVIEETSFLNSTQTASKITDYATFGTLQMPQKIRTKVGSGTEITPITFDTYDTRGNLTKYSLRSGQIATMEYYGTTDLGKTDLLKSQTVGGGSTGTVLSRTMSYDYSPMVGLSSETDINGYTTTYLYDVFNRLKTIKDSQSYLLKDLAYHYAGQAAITGMGVSPTNTLNYIISRTAREAQTMATLDSDVDKTTTQLEYMDGLGRGIQSLVWKGSPDKLKDIISGTTLFDLNGRPYKSILPTPSDALTGAYKSNAQTLASAFYDNDTHPYTETVFEASPLNRPIKQFGAGQAWRTVNNEKFVTIQYLLAGNFIVKFDIQANGTVNGANAYGNSTLINNCVLSERGFQSYDLKDKQGRVTHKFQQMDGNSVFAVTAYVYNDLGQLVYVVPPEIYEKIRVGTITSFTESDVVFKEGIYGYHYDILGRQNEKHIPGAGWSYFVFDKQDRIVYFADDYDKAKDYWQWIKYDALGRKIQSGIQRGNGVINRAALQTAFDLMTTETYEERGTTLLGYTNRSFPNGYQIVDADVMQVIYYDDFLWNTDVNYNFQSANAFHAQGLTKGLMTGMLVRNVETNVWYKSVNYFDYKSRPIQSFSQNHLGGIDRSEYQYRFNGEVLRMRMAHQGITEIYDYIYNHVGQKISFKHTKDGVTQNIARYDLDGIGRLKTKVFKPLGLFVGSKQTGNWTDATTWLSGFLPTVNDNVTINAGQTVTIPSGQFGSMGVLNNNGTLRNFGMLSIGKVTTADLQTVDYSYHIRGGLRGINLDNAGNLTNNIFSMKLAYEDDGTYFDGNIRNQYWKSNIDGVQRAYQYSYDAASRITQGTYASTRANENYALNFVTYDKNGNITALSRNGFKSNNSFGLIDNLAYTYQANSNKIQAVTDISGETASFTDATGSTDYTYALDGSLTSDANKGITVLEYNYLKLPRRIVKNGVTILYQYDATGKKLKETIGTNVTDYSGNTIYKNGSLYQISHDEGRIINGEYEYNIKDHLGNLRVAFRDSLGVAKITQHNAYGIFGEELPSISYFKAQWKKDEFRFTGQENLPETGYTDFGARLYDNIVPRFLTIDPLSELNRRFSPFVYGNANPIMFTDPDGMRAVWNGQYGEHSGYTDDETGESTSWQQVQSEYGLGGGDKPEGIVSIKGKEYYKNTGNIFAKIGNKINALFGGDANYFVEHKPYDRVEEKMNQEFAATAVGTIAGGVIAKGTGRLLGGLFNASSRFGALQHASRFGIDKYSSLRQVLGSGSGLQVHHLFEQRFASILGQSSSDMLSIVVTKAEHQIFTNAWRQEIGYISDRATTITSNATKQDIEMAARKIYQNYPEILKALGL